MTTAIVHRPGNSFLGIRFQEIEESPLSLGEYNAVRQALVEGKPTDARNVLLCRMFYGTGLRCAEVMRLTPAHVALEGPDTIILIKRGKKGQKTKWERMPLNPDLGVALRQYITGNQIPADLAVFHITDRMARYIFAAAGIRAIGRPVHPHQFRSLYIKTLIDGGLPVEVTAAMVGHVDTRTTMGHYYRLTEQQRHEISRRLPV